MVFGVFDFLLKRTKEFDFTTMTPQVDLFSLVFWRKSKTPKNHFEIIWPLRNVIYWQAIYLSHQTSNIAKKIITFFHYFRFEAEAFYRAHFERYASLARNSLLSSHYAAAAASSNPAAALSALVLSMSIYPDFIAIFVLSVG